MKYLAIIGLSFLSTIPIRQFRDYPSFSAFWDAEGIGWMFVLVPIYFVIVCWMGFEFTSDGGD